MQFKSLRWQVKRFDVFVFVSLCGMMITRCWDTCWLVYPVLNRISANVPLDGRPAIDLINHRRRVSHELVQHPYSCGVNFRLGRFLADWWWCCVPCDCLVSVRKVFSNSCKLYGKSGVFSMHSATTYAVCHPKNRHSDLVRVCWILCLWRILRPTRFEHLPHIGSSSAFNQ